MRLLLIRHAESLHNQQGLVASHRACPGLTENGFRQAERLRRRLAATQEAREAAALLSSPALRALQTAQVIAPALPVSGVEVCDGLVEIETGQAEGMLWQDYHRQFGGFDLPAQPERPFAPGGESWNSYLARGQSVLAALAERFAGQTVVAVSHAGWIVTSLIVRFAIPRSDSIARLETDFTGISEWRVYEDRWQLTRFNDCLHLNMFD